MNDTKTLCDVVGKALDEYGNGKAQDAFSELLTHLRDVEKECDEDQGVIRVWRGRCERAEAEVAMLNEALAEEHAKAEGGVCAGPRSPCGRGPARRGRQRGATEVAQER